jgi:hypothetical protein
MGPRYNGFGILKHRLDGAGEEQTTAAAEQIKTILSGLPQRDRAKLAHFLRETLEDEKEMEWRIASPGTNSTIICVAGFRRHSQDCQ